MPVPQMLRFRAPRILHRLGGCVQNTRCRALRLLTLRFCGCTPRGFAAHMVVVAVLTVFVRTMFMIGVLAIPMIMLMIGVFTIPMTMLVAVLVSVLGVTRS